MVRIRRPSGKRYQYAKARRVTEPTLLNSNRDCTGSPVKGFTKRHLDPGDWIIDNWVYKYGCSQVSFKTLGWEIIGVSELTLADNKTQ